jgi:hypothetical protein
VRISVALVVFALMVAGCGDETSPGADSRPSAAPSTGADPLARLFRDGATPLVRTDFSDDSAWAQVVRAVTAPVDFGAEAGGSYEPHVEPLDDRAYDGATAQALADDSHEGALGYVLLADDRTMREAAAGGEVTVVYVDLSVLPEDAAEFGWVNGQAIRCVVGEVADIEANLSIANMDFEEFADSADPDGVYRGLPE